MNERFSFASLYCRRCGENLEKSKLRGNAMVCPKCGAKCGLAIQMEAGSGGSGGIDNLITEIGNGGNGGFCD